ncbi:MAG: pentapeptide repeat-containing protein, partial [Pseudomonadota bacterium]
IGVILGSRLVPQLDPTEEPDDRLSYTTSRDTTAGLERANLSRAKLEAAELILTRMEGAGAHRAQMEAVTINGTKMEGVHLWETNLEGANLLVAKLRGAHLDDVKLERALLTVATMEGAYLAHVSLTSTDCSQANFEGAALQAMEVGEDSRIKSEQVEAAFWDGSLSLPFDPPKACSEPWRSVRLTDAAFLSRWRGWREARGYSWPPPGHALSGLANVSATAPDAPLRDDEVER